MLETDVGTGWPCIEENVELFIGYAIRVSISPRATRYAAMCYTSACGFGGKFCTSKGSFSYVGKKRDGESCVAHKNIAVVGLGVNRYAIKCVEFSLQVSIYNLFNANLP